MVFSKCFIWCLVLSRCCALERTSQISWDRTWKHSSLQPAHYHLLSMTWVPKSPFISSVHIMVQPFLFLPCYRQCQYHDVKHKQYLYTSLVLVTLPCLASLRTGVSPSQSQSWRPQCSSLAPCPAEQQLCLCQQHRAASVGLGRVPGDRGRRVSKSQEGRGTLSPTLYWQSHEDMPFPVREWWLRKGAETWSP